MFHAWAEIPKLCATKSSTEHMTTVFSSTLIVYIRQCAPCRRSVLTEWMILTGALISFRFAFVLAGAPHPWTYVVCSDGRCILKERDAKRLRQREPTREQSLRQVAEERRVRRLARCAR